MRMTGDDLFDLVMGDLDGKGELRTLLVVREGLSHEQALLALELERTAQLERPGRTFDVTPCDGEAFELRTREGRTYRRYFLAA